MTAVDGARRVACATAVSAITAGVLWGTYLTVVGVAAERSLRKTPDKTPPAPRALRFRILVPAHDEEKLIGNTLDSLRALDYPGDLVELHVVADNCSDDTAKVARARGAHVHVREDADRPGKGAALAWLIDRLPHGGRDDAIVVIDADTLVSPGLLTAFERGLADGSAAIQGHYMVKDAAIGGDIGFRAAAFAVRHFVRPAGRTALGGSSSLYGNAMAFRESIARRYRWSNSLTEDLEMGLRLLLDGHHIGFAPDAVIEAEMPASLDDAVSQNERWEAGRLKIATDFVPSLLSAARTGAQGRRWTYIDAAIDISLPPLTTVVATTAGAGAVMAGLARGRLRRVGVASGAIGVGLQALHVLHALRLADAPPAVRRSLMRTPAHIVWKSRLLTRVVRRRPGSWIRTTRDSRETAA